MNKLSFFLFNIVFGFMLISCGKDLQTNIEPTQHESTSIDLDDDGETDFKIRYSQVIIESPISDFGYVALLDCLNNNEVLYNSETFSVLEFNEINAISNPINTPFEWRHKPSSGFSLISIHNIIETNSWPKKWSVNSGEPTDRFIIGLKLIQSSSELTGWIEIRINTYSGLIQVSDKGLL